MNLVKMLTLANLCAVLIFLIVNGSEYMQKRTIIAELKSDSIIGQCHQTMHKKMNTTDFLEYSNALMLLRDYYTDKKVLHASNKQTEEFGHTCFRSLEKRLIPYLRGENRLTDLISTFTPGSKGLVISSCNRFFDYTINLIKGLHLFSFGIPITIIYVGNEDLNEKRQAYFHGMNITTLDITQYIDNNVLQLQGWAIKPFAILVAPFEEVMLIDAEAVFLQSPENMFEDEGYKNSGVLLQKDRAIFFEFYKQKLWMSYHLRKPYSKSLLESQVYNGFSDHQVDSSFLLINKGRRLFTLLAACKLNMAEEKLNFYEHFYGDKESFWMGAEMVAEPYDFLPLMPGIFGRMYPLEKDLLCGRQLMFDREGEPLYFNEGVVWHKYANPDERGLMPMPTHYEYAGRWLEPDNKTRRCLYTKGIKIQPQLATRFDAIFSLYENILGVD